MSEIFLASLAHRKITVSFTQFNLIARFCCNTLLENVPDKHCSSFHIVAERAAVTTRKVGVRGFHLEGEAVLLSIDSFVGLLPSKIYSPISICVLHPVR
jgi:hypothetical protein